MKVFIAGDYCPAGRVEHYFKRADYASAFGDAQSIIKESDYSIVNFECPVVSRQQTPIEKLGPNLKCSPEGVEALQWAGFKCVTLANNHFFDYGPDGVKETLETVASYGMDHVGGGMNLGEASSILYQEINGKTLAVINCCEHEFSIATDQTAGSNPLNPVRQYYAIREARHHADYVLVIVHGGHEHFQLPSLRMVETYRFFVDAGADAVLNHHQHCFSGYETWHGKPIFYGLGNFCFDNPLKRSGIWTEGYCVTIEFTDHNPTFILHPYRQCTNDSIIELLDQNAFEDKLEDLNAIIATPVSLQTALEEYYASSSKYYGNIFEPFYNRIYLAIRHRGWLPSFINKKRKLAASNFVNCEAHRDKLIWWLNHNNKR